MSAPCSVLPNRLLRLPASTASSSCPVIDTRARKYISPGVYNLRPGLLQLSTSSVEPDINTITTHVSPTALVSCHRTPGASVAVWSDKRLPTSTSYPTAVVARAVRLPESRCLVPRAQKSFGEEVFSVAGPYAWNDLPLDLQQLIVSYRLCTVQARAENICFPCTI